MLRSFAHYYPQVPWARAPETRLGLSAFSLLHFVLSLISLPCTSGPNMTPTLVRFFHPYPRSTSLAPRGPHLPACRSVPHELLWASPAYFPSWAPQAPRKRSRASGVPLLPPGGPSALLLRGRQAPHSLVFCYTSPALTRQKAVLASQCSVIALQGRDAAPYCPGLAGFSIPTSTPCCSFHLFSCSSFSISFRIWSINTSMVWGS